MFRNRSDVVVVRRSFIPIWYAPRHSLEDETILHRLIVQRRGVECPGGGGGDANSLMLAIPWRRTYSSRLAYRAKTAPGAGALRFIYGLCARWRRRRVTTRSISRSRSPRSAARLMGRGASNATSGPLSSKLMLYLWL